MLNHLYQGCDEHWAEISEAIVEIETLSEDVDNVPKQNRELAAAIASKTFFHLEEYDDSLRLALRSGQYFDVYQQQQASEYTSTIVGRCIEKYVKIRQGKRKQLQQENEGDGRIDNENGADTAMDEDNEDIQEPGKKAKKDSNPEIDQEVSDQLERVVNGMFLKCYDLGLFNQALGIALEAERLDKVKETLTKPQSSAERASLRSYCLNLCKGFFVSNVSFRKEVLDLLIQLFHEDSVNPQYLDTLYCLYVLGRSKEYAETLNRLLQGDDTYLIAYQAAFDIVELQDAHFVTKVLESLPQNKVTSSSESSEMEIDEKASESQKRLKMIHDILGDGKVAAVFLDYLYRNNKTDPILLKQIKTFSEAGRTNSIIHQATIVSHGYMQIGTTNDSFLRNNLDWLGRASNWAKFSASASLGVIHKGNVKPAMRLLAPFLPPGVSVQPGGNENGGAGAASQSPFSEGGALYALGLIHASEGVAPSAQKQAFNYLTSALEIATTQDNDMGRDAMTQGACLGIGLVSMSSGDQQLLERLRNVLFGDSAVAGEGAAVAMGLIMLGTGSKSSETISELLGYAHDTKHEKIIRGIGLAIAMNMYGQESNADAIIEHLTRDKDPLLRYGGMFTIGLAYVGTGNNQAIRKLLHVAVSDVNNDVRRAAVICLGFILLNSPERLPELIALLSESYNPHLRYGACIALGIGCAGGAPSALTPPTKTTKVGVVSAAKSSNNADDTDLVTPEKKDADKKDAKASTSSNREQMPSNAATDGAIELLLPLLDDKVDFVRQSAYISLALLLMQRSPEADAATEVFRNKVMAQISEVKHPSTMTRTGAILAAGIIDAGGRNLQFSLLSKAGIPKPPAVVGAMLWLQYWFWYPMFHMMSLCLTPSALIGVNKNIDIPKQFSVKIEGGDALRFAYPEPVVEKKEEKKERIKTVELSTTAHAKAKGATSAAAKAKEKEKEEKMETETAQPEKVESVDKEKEAKEKEIATRESMTKNPLRVTKIQESFIAFDKSDECRYYPACADSHHRVGIVVLVDKTPQEPDDVVKVAVPPSHDEDGAGVEPDPPEPFFWTVPEAESAEATTASTDAAKTT